MARCGNPFEGLKPALEAIARAADVLPATGQAIEDLMRPDHAEVVDTLRMRITEDHYFDQLWERGNNQPYVELEQLHRREKHVLRYFLDGSARTFFLGDALEDRNRRTPVNVAQIGATCVKREDNGLVHVHESRHRIVLMISASEVSFAEEVKQRLAEAGERFMFCDLLEKDGESEITSPGKEPRSRAAHKAHHLMAELEEGLGRTTPREEGEWLVLDGSLGKDLYRWEGVPCYMGVTKSFSRTPQFKLPGRQARQVNVYDLLAGLPFSARTCAFAARGGDVAMWYVRLREQRHLDYPLMGVVKIELPCQEAGEPVPSGLVDELSRALIAERHVTPHGKDVRWHAHLYPIYLAEQAVKNGFASTEALKAGLKWPMLNKR